MMLLFEARSLRERLLITASVLSVIWAIWAYTLDGAVAETKVELTQNISQLAAQLKAGTSSQQKAIAAWPERLTLETQKNAAQQELATAKQRIDQLLEAAVNPQDVAVLLRAILAQHSGIEVVELVNLPVKEIVIADQPSGLYRHPLKLTMQGSFQEVVAYIEALEAVPGGLSFRRLDYLVDAHPRAQVVLEIETLSNRQAWFGA